MARGRKPAPVALRLVDGTFRPTRHGDRDQARAATSRHAQTFGPLTMPRELRGETRKAWQKWITPAIWLDESRGAAAMVACTLWAEYREAPRAFPASKLGELRAYLTLLGLTDERQRGAIETPADEFFDD